MFTQSFTLRFYGQFHYLIRLCDRDLLADCTVCVIVVSFCLLLCLDDFVLINMTCVIFGRGLVSHSMTGRQSVENHRLKNIVGKLWFILSALVLKLHFLKASLAHHLRRNFYSSYKT